MVTAAAGAAAAGAVPLVLLAGMVVYSYGAVVHTATASVAVESRQVPPWPCGHTPLGVVGGASGGGAECRY